MPKLLITRVQDVKVLENTVKELNVECERAQEPRFQVRLTLLPKRRTPSSTTWTLTSRRRRLPRKRIKQTVAEPIMARLDCWCGGQLTVGAQLWCRVLWWTLFAGPWLRVGLACGETQDEHVWNLILRRSDVDDHGASGPQRQIFEHTW